jgi:hypothetical protein
VIHAFTIYGTCYTWTKKYSAYLLFILKDYFSDPFIYKFSQMNADTSPHTKLLGLTHLEVTLIYGKTANGVLSTISICYFYFMLLFSFPAWIWPLKPWVLDMNPQGLLK